MDPSQPAHDRRSRLVGHEADTAQSLFEVRVERLALFVGCGRVLGVGRPEADVPEEWQSYIALNYEHFGQDAP